MSARSSWNYPNPLTQAVINTSASGDTTLVTGVASKQIKVFRMKIVINAATSITIKDGSTTIDGPLPFATAGAMILDFTGFDMPPWYTTSAGNNLIINSSNAVSLGGNLDYLLS